MPLAEAAVATGFADQSHMTNVFRRVTGSTPGALRDLLAEPEPEGKR
jgi:AraC family transcriptional regulator